MSTSVQMPHHIAVIMDGNGRWASKRGFSRLQGHKQGSETAKKLIEIALNYNIKNLTLYAFSSENWRRSADEVENMMDLMECYIDSELPTMQKNNIKLIVIGDKSKFNPQLKNKIDKAESETANNNKMNLYIAASYGGREEITNMVKKIVSLAPQNSEINETLIKNCLYSNMPDVDLLIRTGGEKRLSNFLPWHIAYSELLFIEKYWPDFDEIDFLSAISEFNKRKRNFGKVREKK
jgi:undecaprenyl diphosphate synthase